MYSFNAEDHYLDKEILVARIDWSVLEKGHSEPPWSVKISPCSEGDVVFLLTGLGWSLGGLVTRLSGLVPGRRATSGFAS